jgi:hypothetical protein
MRQGIRDLLISKIVKNYNKPHQDILSRKRIMENIVAQKQEENKQRMNKNLVVEDYFSKLLLSETSQQELINTINSFLSQDTSTEMISIENQNGFPTNFTKSEKPKNMLQNQEQEKDTQKNKQENIQNNNMLLKQPEKNNLNNLWAKTVINEEKLPNLLSQQTVEDLSDIKLSVLKLESENKTQLASNNSTESRRDNIYRTNQPTRIEGSLVISNDGTARLFGYQIGSIPNVG